MKTNISTFVYAKFLHALMFYNDNSTSFIDSSEHMALVSYTII